MTKKLTSIILAVVMVLSLCTAGFVSVSAAEKTGVCVDGTMYDVEVGETLTYEVKLQAEELFEDVQAKVFYDHTKLKLVDKKSTEVCPNLPYGLVYYPVLPGEARFNAICLDGFDFTEEKILVTLEFEVMDNSYSEVNLLMEEMTILGDATKSYFTDGKAVITDGISIAQTAKQVSGVGVDGQIYEVEAGETYTYEVLLSAEELFENIQVKIRYNQNKLRLVDKTSAEACPNLTNGLVYYPELPGEVRFNVVNLDGIDFKEEKVLVTLDFEVLNSTYSEIKLEIEEMTIVGDGTQSYFTEGKPSITEGISVTQVFKTGVPYILGDATSDGKVNVKDATEIQKAVAGLVTLEEIEVVASDVDANTQVNVKDATAIQKWVAGMTVTFPIGQEQLYKK